MPQELKQKIKEIIEGEVWAPYNKGIIDRLLQLFEQEKQKAVEKYALEVIPAINKKWRKRFGIKENIKQKYKKKKCPNCERVVTKGSHYCDDKYSINFPNWK